jgi:WD40 repeat protein
MGSLRTKLRQAVGMMCLVSLWLFPLGHAGGQEIVPRKHSLTIPFPMASGSNRSVECVVTLGPSSPVAALAFSPDGKKLAAGGYQEVLVWDLAKATLWKRIGAGQLSGSVQSLVFGKDGRLLAVAEGTPRCSGAVRIFEVESGQATAGFQEPKDVVCCLALSPDGKLLAAGAADALTYLWSIDEKKLVATLGEHGERVLGVAFSADGKFLATGGADRTARVWEAGTWKAVVKMEQVETVQGLAFSPDGQFLALAVGGPSERAIRIRRRDNAQLARTIETGAAMPLDVVWGAQGNRLQVPCSDKQVRVFDAGNGNLLATLSGHGGWVHCVAASADGTTVASGSADGTVKLWSVADWRLLATLVQLSPRSDEWLLVTTAGYLATSSPGALAWKTANLKTPPDKLTSLFQNPELVRQALSGNKIPPPTVE